MPPFKSDVYPVEIYAPGAVSPSRMSVTFLHKDGSQARVSDGDTGYTTGPRSCTCVDFTLGDNVCVHIRGRSLAFHRFAREYGLKVKEVARPIWAEDVRD